MCAKDHMFAFRIVAVVFFQKVIPMTKTNMWEWEGVLNPWRDCVWRGVCFAKIWGLGSGIVDNFL